MRSSETNVEAGTWPDQPPPDNGRWAKRLTVALACAGLGAAVAFNHLRSKHRAIRSVGELRGKTVLISGGARGLGYLLAQEYGRWGARVWIVSRTEAEVVRAEQALRSLGCDAYGLVGDVRDPFDVRRIVSTVVEAAGGLDILVNNAGVIQATPFEHARLDDFADSLRTHLWGPLHLIRETLPVMRRRGDGRIVNIASIGGRIGVPHLVPYSVGKFALVGLSEGLRAEVWKDGIAVTTVCPGLMRTGSHVRAHVRGQHEREARWFGLAVATPLTSISARRAAQRIVWASVTKRARVTIGWQARAAEIIDTLAPEVVAGAAAIATATLLPGPIDTQGASEDRIAGDVGFGWVQHFLPNRAARDNNEIEADPAPLAVPKPSSSGEP